MKVSFCKQVYYEQQSGYDRRNQHESQWDWNYQNKRTRCGRTAASLFVSATGKDFEDVEASKMYYGHIRNPQDDSVIDEVLIVKMNGPHSYTADATSLRSTVTAASSSTRRILSWFSHRESVMRTQESSRSVRF